MDGLMGGDEQEGGVFGEERPEEWDECDRWGGWEL
jgi:hypothetical protein